jgi:hypothetical protein
MHELEKVIEDSSDLVQDFHRTGLSWQLSFYGHFPQFLNGLFILVLLMV